MHEISLAQEVLTIVQNAAIRDNFTKVHKLTIEIGRLSCVEVDAFLFALENQKIESLMVNTKITITQPEGVANCKLCNSEFKLTDRWDSCPECKSNQITITEGEQLKIIDLIVS